MRRAVADLSHQPAGEWRGQCHGAKRAVSCGAIGSGQLVVVEGMGGGFTWASAVIRW